MKKFLIALLAICMMLSLFACGKKKTGGSPTEATKPEEDGITYCPWELDASAQAKKDGSIHYYFMASYGLFMSEKENHPDKWGDSCLIVFPSGETMLIDGGMEAYGPVLVQNLQRLGVKKLDYVVMSHSHNDHCYGLLKPGGVFENFEVGQIYWTGIACAYWEDVDLEAVCGEFGYPMQVLKKGDTLQFGEVSVEVLWPEAGLAGTPLNDTTEINNQSLVMRFDYKNHSSLFTGDLYAEAEAQVVELAGEKLDVDLLKVCHHGSPTSSSLLFLMAVRPTVAVATGYQDVTVEMEERFATVGGELLYDRYHGYVHVVSDGHTMTYDTHQTRAK